MKSLDDVFGEERGVIKLECEVSKEKVKPVWKKDGAVLTAGNKYEQIQSGKTLCLLIHDLEKTDAGLYTCDIGTDVAKSQVSIQGKYCWQLPVKGCWKYMQVGPYVSHLFPHEHKLPPL